jgi:hypothetical protein
MKTALALLLFLAVLVNCSTSYSIDPGTASGTLAVDGDKVSLRYSFAHLHDNAEGWLDTKKEMRILVSDRDVPEETISGLDPFFALSEMVRAGSIRGVLLRFDPANPKSIVVTVLYPPKEGGHTLANRTLANSGKSPLENLRISDVRVSADLSQSYEGDKEFGWPSESYSFKFSAPLFKEPPVTASLKDKEVMKSPQVKAVLAKAAAFKKGDLETARKYTSERSIREMDKFLSRQSKEEAQNMMREAGEEVEQSVKKGKLRLIVRGDHASLIINSKDGNTLHRLIRKDGQWLVD